MAPVTLAEIHDHAAGEAFPRDAIFGCESALVLFAAAFHGRQDAYWIHQAGMHATCVDTDARKLGEMVLAYPKGWEYVVGDAFEYAKLTKRRYDVVTVDCPTNLFQTCANLLPTWCEIARELVILGTGADTTVEPPEHWHVADMRPRSTFRGGVFWTVLERRP